MKLSNFQMIERMNPGTLQEFLVARVDVETGALWWKKRESKAITRELGSYWMFVDTGEYTPGFDAENLERGWKAMTRLKENNIRA